MKVACDSMDCTLLYSEVLVMMMSEIGPIFGQILIQSNLNHS